MKKLKVTVLRPSGNDTALVEGIPKTKLERAQINDLIMSKYKNIEQVGFYDINKRKLEMAGGEFCGNASRAFAFLVYNRTGLNKMGIKVSGMKVKLKAGVFDGNNSYIQIPITFRTDLIKKINNVLYRVDFEGTQLLINKNPVLFELDESQLKKTALKLLEKFSLLENCKASGVIFTKKYGKNRFSIKPVIWVRDISTFFCETACGSGSIALGLIETLSTKSTDLSIKIKQPSQMYITSKVSTQSEGMTFVQISGVTSVISQFFLDFKIKQ